MSETETLTQEQSGSTQKLEVGELFETTMTSANWIAVVVVILYFGLGVMISMIANPHWDWVRALYFTVVSLTTVGYGDFYPKSKWHKIVNSVYLLFGLSLIAAMVGVLTSRLLSFHDNLTPSAEESKKKGISTESAAVIAYLIGFAVIFTGGVVFFQYNEEGIDWYESISHTTATLTTVGYGDASIVHKSTRVFSIFYIFFGVAYTTAAFAAVVAWMIKLERDSQFDALRSMEKESVVKAISQRLRRDEGHEGGTITKYQFKLFCLKQMGKVSTEEVEQLEELYDIVAEADSESFAPRIAAEEKDFEEDVEADIEADAAAAEAEDDAEAGIVAEVEAAVEGEKGEDDEEGDEGSQ